MSNWRLPATPRWRSSSTLSAPGRFSKKVMTALASRTTCFMGWRTSRPGFKAGAHVCGHPEEFAARMDPPLRGRRWRLGRDDRFGMGHERRDALKRAPTRKRTGGSRLADLGYGAGNGSCEYSCARRGRGKGQAGVPVLLAAGEAA